MTTHNALSPVLNTTTGNLVQLPLEHPIVIKYGNLYKHHVLDNIPLIKDYDYKDVITRLIAIQEITFRASDERDLVLEKEFFLNYTNKSMRGGYPAISLAGREIIWTKFLNLHFRMKEIVRSCVGVNWLWFEESPAQFLVDRNENIEGLSKTEIYTKACEYIKDSWSMKLAATYSVDNTERILIYLGDNPIALDDAA